jgi:hypothetical protein
MQFTSSQAKWDKVAESDDAEYYFDSTSLRAYADGRLVIADMLKNQTKVNIFSNIFRIAFDCNYKALLLLETQGHVDAMGKGKSHAYRTNIKEISEYNFAKLSVQHSDTIRRTLMEKGQSKSREMDYSKKVLDSVWGYICKDKLSQSVPNKTRFDRPPFKTQWMMFTASSDDEDIEMDKVYMHIANIKKNKQTVTTWMLNNERPMPSVDCDKCWGKPSSLMKVRLDCTQSGDINAYIEQEIVYDNPMGLGNVISEREYQGKEQESMTIIPSNAVSWSCSNK